MVVVASFSNRSALPALVQRLALPVAFHMMPSKRESLSGLFLLSILLAASVDCSGYPGQSTYQIDKERQTGLLHTLYVISLLSLWLSFHFAS